MPELSDTHPGLSAIAILGMHRSGTSLVAQAFSAAGISPGPLVGLLSAQADNPEGFYENRHLVELNEHFLKTRGGSWFAPPQLPLTPGSVEAREPDDSPGDSNDSVASVLAEVAGDGRVPFFLKDPRLCLTWSHWAPQLPNALVAFVYRSPLSVARSLAARNHFPLQYGLALWELYNRGALQALKESGGLALSYDAIARGDVSLVDTLEELCALGVSCNPAAASEVYKADLSHFSQLNPEAEPEWLLLSDSQRQLHSECESTCRRGSVDAGSVPDAGLGLEDGSMLWARIQDFARALAPLASVVETGNERDDAVAQRDNAMEALADLEADHRELAKAHKAEKKLHSKASTTLKALERDHSALAESHEAEVERHRSLQAAHEKVNEELAERGQELLAVHAERERLDNELRVTTDKADYLFFTLSESFGSLIHFEQSAMARLQRYSRKLYRLATFQRGRNSAYEDVLERAHEHFSEFELDLPKKRPNKLSMAGDVVAYVWRNPAGSARSFSWTRLRRAAQVFFGSSSDELSVWVSARFPDAPGNPPQFDPKALDEGLDELELEFAQVEDPDVSIIVPVYNDYRVTVNCLKSVLKHTQETSYEVIIADDCSTDLTSTLAERIRGVKVVKPPSNVRFLRNCNTAAKAAHGRVLVFLNNDTAVSEHWLERLLEPMKDEHVGITGPKLLFADGRLQEAGGIIWRDASGWNFGRADDPSQPAFNYRRDVDYVSGACLAIRHDLWKLIGGFDTRFSPAYYEDADICFEARKAGFRVVYEPKSVVHHFEGVSNGTDLTSGVKQHQVANQSVFREKWQAVLDRDHFLNAEHVIHARDRSRYRPCVLVIDHYVPHYDRDAGGRSTFMYLRLLRELGCRVQFMGANFFPHEPYTQTLQDLGIEVLVGERIALGLDRWLAEHAPYIDHVFLHRPHVAEQFLPHLERMAPRPTIHYVGHDLHYLRFRREAALKDDDGLRNEGERWERREFTVCERSDYAYYFSEIELDELASRLPSDRLRRLPLYAMPIEELPKYEPTQPQELLFVGGYNHPPNVDAATWLATDILPRVHKLVPDAHLHLVGSNPTPAVLNLAGENVTVHGYVSDEVLTKLYRRVGAAVVPLQYGAGVKGKVIEAISHHVPLVTTDIGAEGIPDAEAVMWIENSAEAIATRLVAVLSGEEDLTRLDAHSTWLREHFDQQRAAECLREAIPQLVGREDGQAPAPSAIDSAA